MTGLMLCTRATSADASKMIKIGRYVIFDSTARCIRSVNLNLHSLSHWSLFNRMWQKRCRELDHRLRFEVEEMTPQMQ